ncbi:hypothetical protein [Faecalibacter bovis]|uniref:Uncharacterized protein n=1 Tax=Faecalibacter bovis TaxID=2898187 RepID=A0ABX7XDW6_9FLAO|nr:hypothetical protein [Faecalibacter bovis]QTV06034.1 hypothetical protein J9309_01415 [Faecalibacter bovis]
MRKLKVKVDYDLIASLINITVNGLNQTFIENKEEKLIKSLRGELFIKLQSKSIAINLKSIQLKYHEAYILYRDITDIIDGLDTKNYYHLKVIQFYGELDRYLNENLRLT